MRMERSIARGRGPLLASEQASECSLDGSTVSGPDANTRKDLLPQGGDTEPDDWLERKKALPGSQVTSVFSGDALIAMGAPSGERPR